MKRLQKRNLEERSDLIDRQRDLEETYEPIVANNQKMAQDVIEDLIPFKEELREINRNIDNLREEHPHLVEEATMTPTLTPKQRILNIGVF